MRSLLDEGVPRALIAVLARLGCEISPFPKPLKGLQNGMLLSRIEAEGFDCLITCDKNLAFQPTIRARSFALLVLSATKLLQIEPMAPAMAGALAGLEAGQVAVLHLDGRLVIS